MSDELKRVPANGSVTQEMLAAGAKRMLEFMENDSLDEMPRVARAMLGAAYVYEAMVAAAPDLQ